MPVAMRLKGKPTKVFNAVMGPLPNFTKRTKQQKFVDKRLTVEETYRVR